jgi:hypothetical protein
MNFRRRLASATSSFSVAAVCRTVLLLLDTAIGRDAWRAAGILEAAIGDDRHRRVANHYELDSELAFAALRLPACVLDTMRRSFAER